MSKLVLLVDDEPDIRRSLSGILEDEGYQVVEASNGADALDVAREEVPDLVLLDIWMPGLDGLQTLERLKNISSDLTVVMMSGHGTIETAVRATKLGAFDFIEKPFSLDKVLITVANAINFRELRRENESLRRASSVQHELVGKSGVIEKIRSQVQRVAPTTTPVLITGENGVGKELVARSIHHYSLRMEKAFVGVNCSAIPEELLASELLGYEKGAFQGASHKKRGKFDLADAGTIFLDDVHELPLKVQGELVRILKERCFERLGGVKPVWVDLRVICATSVSLSELVAAGKFRDDLYQMINVVPLFMPPLRERREDIPFLVRHFVNYFHKNEGWETKRFDESAISLFQEYQWHGNAIELKNVVERVLIMAAGPVITAEDLPQFIGYEPETTNPKPEPEVGKIAFKTAREQFEKDFILKNLEENNWDLDATAREIAMERTTFHRKLIQYRISPPDGAEK